MSNTQSWGGLRLVECTHNPGGLDVVYIPSSDSNRTGIGDPMQQVAGNYSSIGSGPNSCPVQLASATSAVYCVIMAMLPQWSDGTGTMNLSQVYRSASTAAYAMARVAYNSDVWELQDDGATPGLTSGHLNYNYKFIVNQCDTSSGLSKFMIDSANGANTATYPVKVIGPSEHPGNSDPTSAYCNWRVNLNNVVRSGGTGTAGV